MPVMIAEDCTFAGVKEMECCTFAAGLVRDPRKGCFGSGRDSPPRTERSGQILKKRRRQKRPEMSGVPPEPGSFYNVPGDIPG